MRIKGAMFYDDIVRCDDNGRSLVNIIEGGFIELSVHDCSAKFGAVFRCAVV